MAAGDTFIVQTDVGGSTSANVTVPSGVVWAIGNYGEIYNMSLRLNDGTNFPRVAVHGKAVQTDNMSIFSQRPIVDDTVDIRFENTGCSTGKGTVSGTELNGNSYFLVTGSVGGNSNVNINVPSGEVWKATAYAPCYRGDLAYNVSGNESGRVMVGGRAAISTMAARVHYDPSHEPRILNSTCNSKPYALTGLKE